MSQVLRKVRARSRLTFRHEGVFVDSLLPVKWGNGRGVASLGCGDGFYVYLYRRAVHAGQRSVGAGVKRRGTVSLEEPSFHLFVIFR